jgi:hypothetical protein
MNKILLLLKTNIFLLFIAFAFSGCTKNLFEPDIEGTWEEINNTTDQIPTGCDLVINKSAGHVSLCGVSLVHPYNTVSAFGREKARLIVEDGQMHYKQNDLSLLLIVPAHSREIYFLDYDFEGKFLWIIGENTSAKMTATGAGKVFRKKQ